MVKHEAATLGAGESLKPRSKEYVVEEMKEVYVEASERRLQMEMVLMPYQRFEVLIAITCLDSHW